MPEKAIIARRPLVSSRSFQSSCFSLGAFMKRSGSKPKYPGSRPDPSSIWTTAIDEMISAAIGFPLADDFGFDALGKHIGVGYAVLESSAWLVDALPLDPKRVMVEFHDGDDKTPVSVEWVDVFDGKREVVALSPADRADFLVDGSGELRFALGAGDDNVQKLFHRSGAGAPWVLVNDPAVSGRVEIPVGFSADHRTAYLDTDHPTLPNAIVAFDTATQARQPLLRAYNAVVLFAYNSLLLAGQQHLRPPSRVA